VLGLQGMLSALPYIGTTSSFRFNQSAIFSLYRLTEKKLVEAREGMTILEAAYIKCRDIHSDTLSPRETIEPHGGCLRWSPKIKGKLIVIDGGNAAIDSALEFEIECFAQCFATRDRREGFKALKEERKPVFQDR